MRRIADIHVHMSDLNAEKSESMLDILSELGTERATLQSLTYRSPAYNIWLLYWKEKYKKIELSVFGMVHNDGIYSDIPFEAQAKALIAMGCDGIKMMYDPVARKNIGYGLNSEKYDALLTYLEENNIPILIHVNDPEEFWKVRELTDAEKERGWAYFEAGFMSKQEIYKETFEMLDKHPKLRVVFAHCFFLSNHIDEAVRVMETYPNVSFDLAPGWEMYVGFSKDIDSWHDFFEKYADRILFGTDCSNTKRMNAEVHFLVKMALTHDKSEFLMPCYREAIVKGLDLSECALDKICYDNYSKIIGIPKHVNMELVLNAAEKMLGDIEHSDNEVMVKAARWVEQLLKEYKRK